MDIGITLYRRAEILQFLTGLFLKNSEAKLFYWYYLWLTFNGLVIIWVAKSYTMGQDCLVILPLWVRQCLPDWMHKTSFCRKIHGIACPRLGGQLSFGLFSLQLEIHRYIINIFRDTSWRRLVCCDGRTQRCVMSVCVLVFGALWLDVVEMAAACSRGHIRQKWEYS